MSRKAFLFTVALVLLCVIHASMAAVSQSAPAGEINGYVVSVDEKPVSNASVYLYHGGALVGVQPNPFVTNGSGYYGFNTMSPGNYSLEATKDY